MYEGQSDWEHFRPHSLQIYVHRESGTNLLSESLGGGFSGRIRPSRTVHSKVIKQFRNTGLPCIRYSRCHLCSASRCPAIHGPYWSSLPWWGRYNSTWGFVDTCTSTETFLKMNRWLTDVSATQQDQHYNYQVQISMFLQSTLLIRWMLHSSPKHITRRRIREYTIGHTSSYHSRKM